MFHSSRITVVLAAVILFFSAAGFLPAQSATVSVSSGERSRGDDLTIKIAVMGPGSELYFWWGHIALVIDDERTGQSRFYDYGIFSFDTDHFFTNFALGRLLYSCGVSLAERNLANYIRTNRDVTIYTLDLLPEKKEEIRRFAENNVLPENRDYYYHHFKDNCSTRIRDIIDLATDGQFKEAYGDAPGRFTLRQHVRRHTWFSFFGDWLLNFLMGQDIDTPLTVWEEMFLPGEVASRIQDFWYTDPSGLEKKLVTDTEIVSRAVARPAIRDVPRSQWPYELAVSMLIAFFLIFIVILKERKPALGQVILGLSQSLLGLFFGLFGLTLFFMSFFTNHDYTYHNANILFANPLLLAAVPLGIQFARSKNAPERLASETMLRVLWILTLLGILLSMVLKISPAFYQDNLVDQLFMLPFVLVLALEPLGLRNIIERIFWRWLK